MMSMSKSIKLLILTITSVLCVRPSGLIYLLQNYIIKEQHKVLKENLNFQTLSTTEPEPIYLSS